MALIDTADQTPDAPPSNRDRILAGMAAAIGERGYAQVAVADIVRHAHTSRRTFYEHFASKQDCFVALLTDAGDAMIHRLIDAVDPGSPWRDQVRHATTAWLEAVRDAPEIALAWIRDLPALGAEARHVTRAVNSAYATVINRLVSTPSFAADGIAVPSPTAVTIIVGGLRELIATTVEDGGDVAAIAQETGDIVVTFLESESGHPGS